MSRILWRTSGKAPSKKILWCIFTKTFLGEYNPALRKARGVWYTPQPVVNFIVRAVDDIKNQFNLPKV
jgi:predicted helicase